MKWASEGVEIQNDCAVFEVGGRMIRDILNRGIASHLEIVPTEPEAEILAGAKRQLRSDSQGRCSGGKPDLSAK